MVPQELYVVCRSLNGMEFKSDPFVFTGNRDRTRKVPGVPKSQNPQNQSPARTEFNNAVVLPLDQPSINNVTNQFQETAHTSQNENPPSPPEPAKPDSPYVPTLYDDFEDFSTGRFANWIKW